jgi:hypothetical protein
MSERLHELFGCGFATSAAKAAIALGQLTARLKPRPFKAIFKLSYHQLEQIHL